MIGIVITQRHNDKDRIMLMIMAETPAQMAEQIVEYLEWRLARAVNIEHDTQSKELRLHAMGARMELATAINDILTAVNNAKLLCDVEPPVAETEKFTLPLVTHYATLTGRQIVIIAADAVGFGYMQGHGRDEWKPLIATSAENAMEQARQLFAQPLAILEHEPESLTLEPLFVTRDRTTASYFVHCNSGKALFVKEGNFFREQGGLTDEWGKHWTPIIATSIGDARRKAGKLFGVPVSHIHDGEE